MNPIPFVKRHWPWFLGLLLLVAGSSAALRTCQTYSRTASPKVGPLVEAVYGIGTVTARRTFSLKMGVADMLERLYVREGDAVRIHAPLVAFGDGRLVRAPFTGVVTSLPFKEGETLFPQVPVLTLTDLQDPYLVVTLEQTAAIRVRKGQEALLSFENLRDRRLTGQVTSLYPKEGQFYVNIEVPELPAELLVGMTADVAIQVASREEVLQVPLAAVENGKVRVLRGGPPRTLPVKLGATDGLWAEVTEGDLRKDDRLLLNHRNQ